MTERTPYLHAFLTPKELAYRWRTSLRTLEGWRFKGVGPTYTKITNRVLYSRDAVLRAEEQGLMGGSADHD